VFDALREHHTVHIYDMRTDTRWPAFAREAQQRGILSLLSFQLFVRSENVGALNLYGDEPGVFCVNSVIIGGLLAQHAAVAMIGAAAGTQFEHALATRDIIGQAKGMLMQREKRHWPPSVRLLSTRVPRNQHKIGRCRAPARQRTRIRTGTPRHSEQLATRKVSSLFVRLWRFWGDWEALNHGASGCEPGQLVELVGV
jgi:hypothetical protein